VTDRQTDRQRAPSSGHWRRTCSRPPGAAPLRRLHDFGAGYKYPDVLAYLRMIFISFLTHLLSFRFSPLVVFLYFFLVNHWFSVQWSIMFSARSPPVSCNLLIDWQTDKQTDRQHATPSALVVGWVHSRNKLTNKQIYSVNACVLSNKFWVAVACNKSPVDDNVLSVNVNVNVNVV